MDINRNNYEQYFLDFSEGNLSEEQEEILHCFLEFNPDLREELVDFSQIELPREPITFASKDLLKKDFSLKEARPDKANFDVFSVAYLENDLTAEQQEEYERFLDQYPEKEKELDYYKATFLKAETIEYPEKAKLRKKKALVINWRVFAPVAAAAAIALMLFVGPGQDQVEPQLASSDLTEEKVDESKKTSPEEKKEEKKPVPSAITLKKTTSNPIPESTYKPEEKKAQNNSDADQKAAKTDRKASIASLDLRNISKDRYSVSYDEIVPVSVAPTSFNRTSLSVQQLARYEYNRASKMAEDEDAILWSLASNGLKELNKIAGTEMKLLASKDDKGSISGVQFKSRYFSLTTPISRQENE